MSAVYGQQNAHLVILNDQGPESPPSTAAKLDSIARAALSAKIAQVSKAADRARRAARPSFRSWFSTPPPRTFDQPVSDRRLSLSGRAPPRFPPDSLEATTRRLADLYMMSAKYSDALDTYRLLQSDLRGLSGAALVHEASAHEMTALALSLMDGPKQAIGTALEKAIVSYCTAGRRELAVRTTLRAVEFCIEAGFPDSAAGVIIRAMNAVLPEKGVATPAGSAFVEAALAVLSSACCVAYRALRRHRRASLYAFLAATRFSQLRLFAAAACMAREIDDQAMRRPPVQQDVEFMFGSAEAADGRHARAVNHFVGILARANSKTDVEVQGNTIRAFLSASASALDAMSKRWDSGARFPLIEKDKTLVVTHDSSGGDDWHALEDDVLEDVEFFRALSKNANAKRERRIDVVAAELRRRREKGDDDTGGSLEMKIRRMRELAETRRKRLREGSLLERGAVVGERVILRVSLKNPTQFPVFLTGLSAVVSIEGRIYHSKIREANGVANGSEENGVESESEDDVLFFPSEDITLGPSSSQLVSLEVSVRKQCEIRFVGVHWLFTIGMGWASPKLPNAYAPGFCELWRLGRRLNDTRKQRASEVPLYAEDNSLTVHIAALEPRVKAKLLCYNKDGLVIPLEDVALRSGETREATLRIMNEGEVALKDLTLRLGTPQTLFVGLGPEVEPSDEGKATFAIDMYDDIARQDEMTVATRVTVNLEPKEDTEIPVWVSATVHRSAFGYRSDLHGNIKRTSVRVGATGQVEDGVAPCLARLILAYGNDRIRFTRAEACMKVLPSLTVSPRFLRQTDSTMLNELGTNLVGVLLGVEVEHAGSAQHENVAIEVTNLSVTSKSQWRPFSLLEATKSEREIPTEKSPSETVLRINETGTFFVFIVKETDQLPEEEDRPMQLHWRTHRESLTAQAPLENEGTSDKVKEEMGRKAKAATHFVLCSQASSLALVDSDPEKIHVSIGWRSDTGLSGELQIPPISPMRWIKESDHTTPTLSSANWSEENHDLIIPRMAPVDSEGGDPCEPISLRLDHPKLVEHEFATASDPPSFGPKAPIPAVVPVDLCAKNISTELVDVIFQAQSTGGVADGDRGRFWSGEVSKTLRAIAPGAERCVHLNAILLRPGEYDMAKFSIWYQSTALTTNIRVRKQMHIEPSYVTVKAASMELSEAYDLYSADMYAQSMEVVLDADNESTSPGMLPARSNATPAPHHKVAESETPTRRGERIERPRTDYSDRSASTPAPADERKNSTPQKATSGKTIEQASSRSTVDKRKMHNLLKPSPDDAFWNDADTDESE